MMCERQNGFPDMTGSDEVTTLEVACFDLARNTKWRRSPIDIAEIQSLARKLTEIAKDRARFGEALGIDVALVTRAVHYLNQAHAMPPMDDDTVWFSNMLDAVIEIARPNTGLRGEARAFLRDLLEGIGTFID